MATRDILAANLRTLRGLRRMGQQELAQRVHVSRRTIARLESGEVADPGIDQVRAIAEALGVTLDLLIREPLVPVSIPVPERMRQQLESRSGPDLLERIVQEVDGGDSRGRAGPRGEVRSNGHPAPGEETERRGTHGTPPPGHAA